jgi:hypothetical protein
MTRVGFDGIVRRKPPLTGAWFAISFLLTCLYWVVCWHWLNRDWLIQALFPYATTVSDWHAIAVSLTPFVFTLGLAFFFRVPEREFWFWILLIIAAEFITGFATLVSIMILLA